MLTDANPLHRMSALWVVEQLQLLEIMRRVSIIFAARSESARARRAAGDAGNIEWKFAIALVRICDVWDSDEYFGGDDAVGADGRSGGAGARPAEPGTSPELFGFTTGISESPERRNDRQHGEF